MPDRRPPEPPPDDAPVPAPSLNAEAELDALLESATELAGDLVREVGPSDASPELSPADLAFLKGQHDPESDAELDAQLARLDSLAAETSRQIGEGESAEATTRLNAELPPRLGTDEPFPIGTASAESAPVTPDEFVADDDLTRPPPDDAPLDAFGVPPARSARSRPAPQPPTGAKPATAAAAAATAGQPGTTENGADSQSSVVREGQEWASDDLTAPLVDRAPAAGDSPADSHAAPLPFLSSARVAAALGPAAERGVRLLERLDKPFARLSRPLKDVAGHAAVATLLVAGLTYLWSLIR